MEDVLDKGLKGCRGIGQTKGHDTILEMAITSVECGFLGIIFMDVDLVIAGMKVDLREDLGAMELVGEVIDEGDGEPVLDGDAVECMIVYTYSKFTIFLLDKNDW